MKPGAVESDASGTGVGLGCRGNVDNTELDCLLCGLGWRGGAEDADDDSIPCKPWIGGDEDADADCMPCML